MYYNLYNTIRTHELWLVAVKQNGLVIQFVPKEHRTLDLCLAAVLRDGKALQFVPLELITPEMIEIAKRLIK